MSDPRDTTGPGSQPEDDTATRQAPEDGKTRSLDNQPGTTQIAPEPSTRGGEAVLTPGDPPAPPTETGKRKIRAAPAALRSFPDLIRAAYGEKRKRLNPKKAEILAMSATTKLEPTEWEELWQLSASDRTLERTRELMLLSMDRFDTPLDGKVREFVGKVLRRHPAFLAESLTGVLENRPDGPSEEAAVSTLTAQSYSSLPWPDGLADLKKKEAEQCRVNALYCLLLWFRETRGIAFERLQRWLQTIIWEPAARRYKSDPQKLRVLMGSRDPAGIAIACNGLEKQARDQALQAAAARRAEERAKERADELDSLLAAAEAELKATRARAEQLAEHLKDEQEARSTDKAHLRDDYEELRGRVLRNLREQQSLLSEGLHALRRNPPKVSVMDDHAERAIDGLKREIEKLRGDN